MAARAWMTPRAWSRSGQNEKTNSKNQNRPVSGGFGFVG
jgi:hypothetical protein